MLGSGDMILVTHENAYMSKEILSTYTSLQHVAYDYAWSISGSTRPAWEQVHPATGVCGTWTSPDTSTMDSRGMAVAYFTMP